MFPQSPQAMHLQTIPWVGLADNSYFHSFNKYLLSPCYVLKPVHFAFPGTLPTVLGRSTLCRLQHTSELLVISERWKGSSELGLSSTGCLGKKRGTWHQEGIPHAGFPHCLQRSLAASVAMEPAALPPKAAGDLSITIGSATSAPGRGGACGVESYWLLEHLA